MAADTNTFASMTTSTVELTDQLVARRRRAARTSSAASSSASSSSSVLLASTLAAKACRVVAVKLSHADWRVTPRASPICCHDAPADRAAMTCSRRIRSSSCSLSVSTRSAANGSSGRASGTTITLTLSGYPDGNGWAMADTRRRRHRHFVTQHWGRTRVVVSTRQACYRSRLSGARIGTRALRFPLEDAVSVGVPQRRGQVPMGGRPSNVMGRSCVSGSGQSPRRVSLFDARDRS